MNDEAVQQLEDEQASLDHRAQRSVKEPPTCVLSENTAETILRAGSLYRYKESPRVIALELPDHTYLARGDAADEGQPGDFLVKIGGRVIIMDAATFHDKFLPAKRR